MAALWINEDYWACTEHMRTVRLPAGTMRCWYAGCRSARPLEQESEDEPGHSQTAYEARHQQRLERGERSLHSDALAPEELLERARRLEEAARRLTLQAAAVPEVPLCQWEACDEPARPDSKYCSRKCSNKNARARYLKRQRAKSASETAKKASAKSGEDGRSAA